MAHMIRKVFNTTTKAVDGEARKLLVTISTKNPDRSRDVVQPAGVVLDHYIKNPVVGAFHDYSKPAIGRANTVEVLEDKIVAEVEFVPEGTYGLADVLYPMYKDGFMSAWSIGFIGKEWKDIENGGREFLAWELLEFSAVLVPDNPEALTMLRSKGIDPDKFEVKDAEPEGEPKTNDPKEDPKPDEPPADDPAPDDEPKDPKALEDYRQELSSVAEQARTIAESLDALLGTLPKMISTVVAEYKTREDKAGGLLIEMREHLKARDRKINTLLREVNTYLRKGKE